MIPQSALIKSFIVAKQQPVVRRHKFFCIRAALSVACIPFFVLTSMAQEKDSGQVIVETVVEKIKKGRDIAIQPQTSAIFMIADNKVVRVKDDRLIDVIIGFEEPDVPNCLCFFDRDTLIVGGGELKDQEEPRSEKNPKGELFRMYKVPLENSEAISADKVHGDPKVLHLDSEESPTIKYDQVMLATTGIFATMTEGDKEWIALGTFDESRNLEELARKIDVEEQTELTGIREITLSPQGYLALLQSNESNSNLLFVSEEGEFLGKFELPLSNLSGLAYGPKFGRLYTMGAKPDKEKATSLYKLVGEGDDRTKGCRCDPIVDVPACKTMKFAGDGNLYLLTESDNDSKILRVKGLDLDPAKKK